MKKWLIIILSIFTLNSHSQIKFSKDAFIDSEQVPTFPGRTDSIWCFLESNFNYDILNACSDKNKYVVRFRVDTTGTATDFGFVPGYPPSVYESSCLNANDSIVRSEILRVLKMMPKWEPGYLWGKKTSWWFSIPISTPYTDFKCQNNNYWIQYYISDN